MFNNTEQRENRLKYESLKSSKKEFPQFHAIKKYQKRSKKIKKDQKGSKRIKFASGNFKTHVTLLGLLIRQKTTMLTSWLCSKTLPCLLAKQSWGRVALSSTRHNYSTTQVIKTWWMTLALALCLSVCYTS